MDHQDASACVRSNQGSQMLSGLIARVELFQNTRHERNRTQDRNLQTFWRSVRAGEQDSISTVRPEKMVCNWFRGVSVRAFGRCRLQFPIAVWQFSIASDSSGSAFTSLSSMETVARGGGRCACAPFFRFGNRADVVKSTRQFHLYRLCRPKSGGNRGTVARISERREQLLFIPAGGHVRRIAIGRTNPGKRAGLVEARRG